MEHFNPNNYFIRFLRISLLIISILISKESFPQVRFSDEPKNDVEIKDVSNWNDKKYKLTFSFERDGTLYLDSLLTYDSTFVIFKNYKKNIEYEIVSFKAFILFQAMEEENYINSKESYFSFLDLLSSYYNRIMNLEITEVTFKYKKKYYRTTTIENYNKKIGLIGRTNSVKPR